MNALSVYPLIFLVIGFNILQWLIAPYIVDAMYRIKDAPESKYVWLHAIVERFAKKSGMSKPRVMISSIPIPNAFAYGSPLTGRRIAVTTGLIQDLAEEEIEAVIGHELGHLKHKDVQVMMFASVLPAVFYFIGFSLMLSSMFGRQRETGGAILIGILSMAIYWILSLLVLMLSRFREYSADAHSASIVEGGSAKLAVALAKITTASGRYKATHKGSTGGVSGFKALFISDPDKADHETVMLTKSGMLGDRQLIREISSRELTFFDHVMELFSTHPNIVKRLRSLEKLA